MNPVDHLNLTSKIYPKAWSQVELMRQDRGTDIPDWPNWCFLPMAGYYSIVSSQMNVDQIPVSRVAEVPKLAAIGAWRYSQGIYQIEKPLYESLISTKINGDIPAEVLYRLPEWCVYIDTGGETGFWAHLEYDINSKRTELRFLVNEDSDLNFYILHIGDWSIDEAIQRMLKEAEKQRKIANVNAAIIVDANAMRDKLTSMLSLVLYLCSEEPDYPPDNGYPSRPKPKKTKKGWRLFAPKNPRIWKIGERVSEKIISIDQGGTHKGPIPHLRRAHWHGYWTGAKSEKQKFKYKFLPPILVNADE